MTCHLLEDSKNKEKESNKQHRVKVELNLSKIESKT